MMCAINLCITAFMVINIRYINKLSFCAGAMYGFDEYGRDMMDHEGVYDIDSVHHCSASVQYYMNEFGAGIISEVWNSDKL